jgi:DNA-3-methyladenine glycosylase I
MQAYHDNEWGAPVKDDLKLFEFLVLDAFQAGLSWSTILKKRQAFHHAFDGFNPEKIARYDEGKIHSLLMDSGIIRNRLKIRGTVQNAQSFLRIQEQTGSFSDYIWQFTGGRTVQNQWESQSDIPATSIESDRMSRELKRNGFTFVGSTICYAFMQAAGLVNDHVTNCYRYHELL